MRDQCARLIQRGRKQLGGGTNAAEPPAHKAVGGIFGVRASATARAELPQLPDRAS